MTSQNVTNKATTCLLQMIQLLSLVQKNVNLLFQKGNEELKNIDNWLRANKLSFNAKKTKYILFSSCTTKTLSKESVLTIRKNQIERVTLIRLLGVIFIERLTWKDHMAC